MDTTTRGSLTFSELLQVALIVLKLCHVISWSWWLVFLPSLLGLAIFLIVLVVLIFVIRR